jgi:hypothetical protein
VASRIGDYPKIIPFRNVLIQKYDLIDHAQVWKVVREPVPVLRKQAESILQEFEDKKIISTPPGSGRGGSRTAPADVCGEASFSVQGRGKSLGAYRLN